MKKLDLLLTVMMCFCVILMRGQEVPFRVMFSVTEASCYNNGKIEYALTDPEGNVLESVPSVLSQVRAYYKLSESDSAHYSGWYYTGGTDTLTVNSGNYIVGVEALLADGGEYVRVDTHLLIVVGSTYQKPEVSALYLTPRRYENAGLVPSVSCLSTGRVQLRIENGRFPYTVTVCDHSTGDTLRTTVFEDRQYNGTNLNYYDYKDYYSFDSMPAGNWDFYLVDGCGYGYPRINQDVAATQLPKLENVHIYASTGNFSDSNVVNVLLELDREALLFEELMDQYVRYRLVYDGLMEGDWKKLPSLGTLVQLFDTLSDVGSYCDLMDRDITLEYRIALCEDTVFRKTFQYYRPNPLYFQKDTADIQDSIVYDPNPCLYLKHWHRHYYSIRYYSDLFSDGVYYPRRLTPGHDHIYYRYHYTHPLTWIYTDIRSGDVIKRDTVATIVNNSYLYVEDVEAHYGSVQDTVLTIPVERKLLEAKGCVLYSTLDTMTFFRCRNQIGNCWKMSHTGEDHCCEQMREVRVHAGFPTRVDPDGTIVRLVESPYNNHYNFEAVYHSNTRSWQVVRSSVENTAMISGGVDGCSLALRDYCLPSGPYTFEIITPCDSFTVSDHIDFPYIYRTQVTEEPSYEIIRECANLYLKYTKGKLFKIRYNTSPETGLPLEEESRQLTFNVDVVSGPLGGYTPRKYFVGDMIRISLPGTYVFKVYANPNEELCELPEYYDTVYFNETTVEFEYAFALLCDSSSNSGNAFVLGSNGVKPYTYTLYDHPDKQGEVLGINHTGQFMDVPMRADQELSCLVEDSCHAYFHVNFYPRALADMQKVWFDGGLTVSEACEGSTIQVHALSIGDVLQYEWSGPNQFHAISPDPFVFVPRGADEGWYKVVIHNNSCSEILIDSILLIPKASPRVTLEQDTLVCPGQPVELRFTPTSPLSDSVVTFTIAFADDEGVQFRNYAALSGVTVTDTFITNKDAMIYPLRVSDGRCDYTLTDAGDTLYVRVRTDVPHTCTIQTTYDTVCHGGNARLLARSSMEPPYTLRWYGDYDLSRLLKSDLIPDSASWSFFDTNGIVKRTLLYATVEKEGMCPPVNGLYTNVMNMHEGTTVLECGQSVRMFDSGGPEGDYIPGERIVHRFVSSDGKPVSILFEEMSVSTTSHLLVISGGGLSPDSMLYDFTAGMENPGLLVSNGDTLTLFFISGEVPAAGWSAVAGQAPGVAIADVWKRDTVFLRDEVCQSTTADYDDPYGVAPMVASSEELNQAIRQAGTYNFTGILEGMGGHDCDSVVTFTLQVNPSYSKDTTIIVHDLGTAGFFWHGIYYKESGQYTYLMSTSDGCDSVEILNLVIEEPEPLPCDSAVYDTIYYVVRPDKVVNDQVTVACTNFQGVEGPGVYFQNDTLTSINECDSVVTVYLIVEEVVSDTVCDSVYLENGTWEPYTEYYEWNENPIESLEYDEHGYYVLPGQLILNGVPIDTNTYLLLTMNPIGESADELNLCLNGDAYTTDYRGQVSVTVSADGNVTASSLKPDEVEVLTGVGQGNTIILRMTTENGCDSVVTLTVNYEYVQHETLYKDTLYADEPYTVVFSNHEFTVNGPGIQTYTETLTGSNGCDSVVTLQLIVNQLTEGDTTAVACESFTWYGETYTTSGDYTQIMTDMSGRDSVVTLHLTVNHGTFGDTTAVACESYEWHGVTYTESGTYTYSYTTADGCEGVDTLHLTVYKPEHTAVSVTACDRYEWHGTTYTSGGDYTFSHEDANGCTQVDTLHLTLHSAQYARFDETACDSYEWHGVTYTESGTYTYPYSTGDGCEGVDTLHLTVYKPVHTAVSVTACDRYEWHGITHTSSGDYTYRHEDANGCIQVDTLHLTLHSAQYARFDETACDSYEWHGVTYTESGTYTYSYSTGDGCEGVDTLHLTVHKPEHTAVSVTACDSYEWHGITYTSSGDYTYSHEDANGCTQVDTLHLTLHSAQYAQFSETACESYEWYGVTYTESGIYTYSYTTADGCEGVDTLHLTVHKPVHTAVSVTACDSYEWHGTTYTSGGDYTFSHEDANGCTQVDTLHLTLHFAQYARFDATACDSYEWHGVTYTESGTYTYSYYTGDGCEGVDTLHLTVHKPEHTAVSVMACDSYEWHGITYTSSGDYTYSHEDANGCTQVDTLHLTLHFAQYARFDATACDSYEWHGVTYTESGTYTYSYTTGDGCEGVDTLHLTVYKPEHTAVSVTACDSYEWHGTTYTSGGDYTFSHEDANGCIQVDTLHLTLHSAQYARFAETACESYEWHGVTYTESGTYTYSYTTADGCEGVDTLHLTVYKPEHTAVSVTACDRYEWHGITYTSSGDYTYRYEDANGCTQVDTLHLTLHFAQYARFDETACDSYDWHGVTYTESGVYTYSYTTADGCEGVDTLHLTVHKLSVNVATSDEVCGDDGSVTVDVTEGLAPIVYSLDGITSQSSNEFSGLSDGTYTIYVTDANGCETTTNVTIAPAPIVVLNLTCPPTYNATLAYGDCVMEIYPEAFGTPTATIYPAEWPFEISNEVPEDNLYYEGTTTITYTMTDQVCGNAVTCEQHIVVVFPQCPDAVDCEGNVYHSVRIGCDCWTQTNLLSNCYGSPNECAESGGCEDPIPCVYEYESESFPNVEQNVDIYGRLYCAEAALDDSVINEHGHIRGICPEGWYLPTPEQYEQLYLYGGGTSIQTANGLRSPMYWLDGGGDDATGFRALPAGYYNGAAQQYERMLLDTYFWATEVVHGEVRSTAYKLTYDCNEIQRTDIHSGYGISVRCVKEKNYDVEEMY